MGTLKNCAVIWLLFLAIWIGKSSGQSSPCGDWEPFKDEKCFQIFDKVGQTFDAAVKTCHQNGGHLITIKLAEEQTFLANFLFNKSKIVNNVWLGAKYHEGKLKFEEDGADVTYKHWAPGYPKSTANDHCVQLDQESGGKWMDEPCTRNNVVVCEKNQIWTIDKLQKLVMELGKKLDSTERELRATKSLHTSQIDKLKKNPVPIGFLYTQLPGQPEPSTLWPTIKFEEVSSNYSGLFFRVAGGSAAEFGTIQEDNTRRLISIHKIHVGDHFDSEVNLDQTTKDWIGKLWTGSDHNVNTEKNFYGHEYKVSSGEIRPRNQAMRIWKRIA